MVRAHVGLMALAAAALWAAPTLCDEKPPPTGVRTEGIFVTPPDGWQVSVWQGGSLELAEFTPPGQTGGDYVDLLGYSVAPRVEGANDTVALMRAFERKSKTGCRIGRVRDHANSSGW